ncbi:mechanosensitive ion channel family protein [Marinobacter sp. 1_MG-2023]|uniref:mechanosensitive ion channel family protein n=1 Tax=Marinobacter sp. 1_MG-2023 TaxID=3062627 RepID=UPI0026E34FAB|nr:mechanosensitive ion channel domain-containing protein [Marinobacter sp. 1_MG-2023]MDO6823238.1 mechanosensitive ion channel [Marinobacter sp. 1_MG-2023]
MSTPEIRLQQRLGAIIAVNGRLLLALILTLTACIPSLALAQQSETEPAGAISLQPGADSDALIAERIASIFNQIPQFESLQVTVNSGVVALSGQTANDTQAQRALSLASRVEGAIAVDDRVVRTLDLQDNLNPLWDSLQNTLRGWIRALPLLLVAFAVFAVVAFAGHRLAGHTPLWSRLTRNPFLAELAGHAVRLITILLGLILALNILGATALMGTLLGGAGVLGLAISFAVKDSMENYISSIMLSIRQPFRAQEHVVINDYEGVVVRLTSRSTVLMTLDGNHLRIPNATVFKAVILNYTRNPQRRFDFVLGVDAEDDPAQAIQTGLAAIQQLDWVLADPEPHGIIESVGDSNILIKFMAWIDQRESDYGKARSLSIRAAKNALESEGFTLPEPIYRLRFDQTPATLAVNEVPEMPAKTEEPSSGATGSTTSANTNSSPDEVLNVRPDTTISRQVREERREAAVEDLLDDTRPIE